MTSISPTTPTAGMISSPSGPNTKLSADVKRRGKDHSARDHAPCPQRAIHNPPRRTLRRDSHGVQLMPTMPSPIPIPFLVLFFSSFLSRLGPERSFPAQKIRTSGRVLRGGIASLRLQTLFFPVYGFPRALVCSRRFIPPSLPLAPVR